MKDQNQTLSEATRAKRPVRTQLWFDSIARATITSGGVGTILVAFLIVVVMISQLLPLFSSTELTPTAKIDISNFSAGRSEKLVHEGLDRSKPDNTHPLCAGMDEYGDIVWILFSNGSIETYATLTGQRLQSFSPNIDSEAESNAGSAFEAHHRITCYSVADDDASLLVGYDNGAVRPISMKWKVEYIDRENTSGSPQLAIGSPNLQSAVITALPNGLLRAQRIESIQFHDLIPVFDHPVRCIDWITPEAIYGLDKAKSWRWLASDGNEIIVQHHLRRRQGLNQATNEEIRTWRTRLDTASISDAMLNAQGNGVTTLNSDGLAQLWKLTPDLHFRLTASHWTIAGSDNTISKAVPILGRNTLLISTNDGQLEGVVPFFGPQKTDLLSIHRFRLSSNRITQITPATNSRVASAVTEDGKASLVYIPTNRRLLDWVVEPDSQVFFSAGSRFLGTLSRDSVTISRLTLRFPEAGWRSFLGANWFEGYDSPSYMWQSSSGTVQGEIKLSMVPLIFGTIKATFYTLLIAIPLGLISAIFSSEYLHPTTRASVKPIMELMASVPSVALGFVGAVALAPLMRNQLFAVLFFVHLTVVLFATLPFAVSMLPHRFSAIANRFRGLVMIGVILTSFMVSNSISSRLETSLFGGPINLWLSGEFGSEFPGWFCILLLPCGITTFCLAHHFRWDRTVLQLFPNGSRGPALKTALLYINLIIASLGSAAFIAWVMAILGWDVRGTLLDSYQERNALLVGVVLGFAIVPLIFTLSEDALQAVPQHLRAASMSCGATVWQTTVRVVIPTAISGLFSAVMLGLGRAIGETMVVLMVSGNSPIMEWNPFSGFRTLSATLATELPEAARGSTHYHSLFFVSLILFVLTIAVNSMAEYVRIRFKRNASQL